MEILSNVAADGADDVNGLQGIIFRNQPQVYKLSLVKVDLVLLFP